MGYGIKMLVKGPRACFTRPEMKAERVSYDVMTPSAARGILEAVYWKPAITWHIDSIEVLNKIRFETFRRNEVGSKLPYSGSAGAKSIEGGKNLPLYETVSTDRQQRATLLLRDVAYVVNAHFDLTNRVGEDDTVEKHYNIVLRRLRKGQCFNQPYLGCREFSAEVSLVEEGENVPLSAYAGVSEKDLGFMLYDLDFADMEHPEPKFFRAVMRGGVIDVSTAAREVIG
ncbi:type I-C CRISPR-associated protein Cas5c [Atopobium sp. oral taxon 199]|uniref:type I-C CRISPR-associated protein Cas5c n=1 Tax=Atopobium sp. oral taxon 199 TaxID=712156 RepID=UPI00034E0EDC|nr:type I-C CRISPR-associated protein Cas5c [Atopobium sp. oral taxon 199]EPD77060.1 CRISPR-associated protein cas5, subtype I-c/dvulg [Atopobium sp. oral taxon 199 str. F0494]